MLLWHTWAEGDVAALNNVLATFHEIHPDVSIKAQPFADMDEMLAQFQVAADAGLGPDLVITSGQQVRALAEAGLIDPIDSDLDDATKQRYYPAALDSLLYRDQLYGLPLAMDTLVLYYDNRLVKQPAATLDALLADAAQGRLVALSTNFVDAYWGVNAFGGSLFEAVDEPVDKRRVILDRGGFANWLAWLKEARDTPGMLLDSNRDVLRSRFIEDGVSYYIGYASEYRLIVDGNAEMPGKGEDAIGVAMLPAGPTAGAAPFLNLRALLFSAVSSDNQRTIALEFAQFLTNAEQQSTLMREIRLVPANNRVRVNPRLDPVVATFTAQARAAVPIFNVPEMDAVLQYGGDAYTRVLEGVIDPAEASSSVTAAINEANGFDLVAAAVQKCQAIGTIYLGYVASDRSADALTALLAQLRRECPFVIVNAVPIAIALDEADATPAIGTATMPDSIDATLLKSEDADILAARLTTSLPSEGRLDLLWVPHRWIPALATRTQLRDLSPTLSAEQLQRYRPAAVDAMRYQGKLYGLPMSISLDALYYNRTMVSEPAHTLDELLQQATAGTPVMLDYTFRHSFWGIPAFGGRLLTEQGILGLESESLTNWLSWLQAAGNSANFTLIPDRTALFNHFVNSESAYYVGGPGMLTHLQRTVGADLVGVARLPSGPNGDAGPLLSATGFLFNARLSETQFQNALTVADYLTNVESQLLFLEQADQLPTNIGLNIPPEEPMASFLEQARTAVLFANTPAVDLAVQQGDSVYLSVIEEALSPAEVAEALLRLIDDQLAEEPANNRPQ